MCAYRSRASGHESLVTSFSDLLALGGGGLQVQVGLFELCDRMFTGEGASTGNLELSDVSGAEVGLRSACAILSHQHVLAAWLGVGPWHQKHSEQDALCLQGPALPMRE